MKKILIINGHPDKESLCAALANSYKRGAETANADCKLVNLIDLKFDLNLHYGYRKRTELEPDLLNIQKDIIAAEHIVIIFPIWWGTYPALLKGFIDRVFLPKFAFKYRENSLFWDKLLEGKTGRLIITMDSPKWYSSLVYKNPGHNSIKKALLEFCGVKPVRVTTFAPVKTADEKKREMWLKEVERLGQMQK